MVSAQKAPKFVTVYGLNGTCDVDFSQFPELPARSLSFDRVVRLFPNALADFSILPERAPTAANLDIYEWGGHNIKSISPFKAASIEIADERRHRLNACNGLYTRSLDFLQKWVFGDRVPPKCVRESVRGAIWFYDKFAYPTVLRIADHIDGVRMQRMARAPAHQDASPYPS